MIYHGDCLDVLKTIPDNSVDSCVTDPPYGLSREPDIVEVLTKWLDGEDYHRRGGGFMGKTWDSFVPGPSVWREVYRVLKPGAHLLCFAGTRTQDLMTISLRLAGFEIRDVVEWLYFSGFPKSLDVGKAFDRRRKEDLPAIYAVTKFIAEARDRAGKTNRDIDEFMGTNGMAGHWTTQGSQPKVPKLDQWYKLKEFLGMSDEMDAEVWRLNGRKGKPGDAWFEREKIGEAIRGPAGFSAEMVPRPWKKKIGEVYDITAPATPLAEKWDGWGTALKPAHEPIIMARKPLDGTVADNAERWGTGAINIDGCRIPTTKEDIEIQRKRTGGVMGAEINNEIYGKGYTRTPAGNEKGRFPANCVTTEPDAFFSKYFNVTPPELCKKASKKDRNSDWRGEEISLPLREKVFGNDKGDGFGRGLSDSKYSTRNNHPTVKPTDLMAWLVRLVTPPGGVVLDPFAGSGSTLVAAKREGFDFIGIEREKEYVEIAKARTGAEVKEVVEV